MFGEFIEVGILKLGGIEMDEIISKMLLMRKALWV